MWAELIRTDFSNHTFFYEHLHHLLRRMLNPETHEPMKSWERSLNAIISKSVFSFLVRSLLCLSVAMIRHKIIHKQKANYWLHKPQQATLQEPQRNMTSKKTESLVQSNDTIWELLNIQKTVQSSNIHMRTLKSPKKECPQKTVKSNNPCKHQWEIWACRT